MRKQLKKRFLYDFQLIFGTILLCGVIWSGLYFLTGFSIEQVFIQSHINDPTDLRETIVKICDYGEDIDKVLCVEQAVQKRYEPLSGSTELNIINGTIYGDCDTTMNYLCDIFIRMGFECRREMSTKLNHAWGSVIFDNGYCTIDNAYLDCRTMGDGENDILRHTKVCGFQR